MQTLKPKKSKVKKVIAIFAIILAVLFVVFLGAIPAMIMPSFFEQRYEQKQHVSTDFGVASARITLTTEDNLSIAAWRVQTANPKGTVIILSGIHNPSVTAFFGYAKMLSDYGWDSLLIEMRGRSESEGEEIGLGLTEWMDVKAGVDFLSQEEGMQNLPIVAMGTSMGGSTVITAAGQCPEIDAVISLSAFSSWSSIFVEYMVMYGMPRAVAVLDRPFIDFYLGMHFGFNPQEYAPIKNIGKLGQRPILLMHSTEDSQVPYSEFEKLLEEVNKQNVAAQTFIRGGNEHFICYDAHFANPIKDVEFSQAIFNFLELHFPGDTQ